MALEGKAVALVWSRSGCSPACFEQLLDVGALGGAKEARFQPSQQKFRHCVPPPQGGRWGAICWLSYGSTQSPQPQHPDLEVEQGKKLPPPPEVLTCCKVLSVTAQSGMCARQHQR